MKSPAVAIPLGFAITTSAPAPAQAAFDFGAILAGATAVQPSHASIPTRPACGTRPAPPDARRATRDDEHAAAPDVDSTLARQLAVVGGMPAGPIATVISTDAAAPISTPRESTFSTADAGVGANANVFSTSGNAMAGGTRAAGSTFSTAGTTAEGATNVRHVATAPVQDPPSVSTHPKAREASEAATVDTSTRVTTAAATPISDASASGAVRGMVRGGTTADLTPPASVKADAPSIPSADAATRSAKATSGPTSVVKPNATAAAIANASTSTSAAPKTSVSPNADATKTSANAASLPSAIASPTPNASVVPTPNANATALSTANPRAIPTANAIPNAAPLPALPGAPALRDSRPRGSPAVDSPGHASPNAGHAPDMRGAPATRLEGGRSELPEKLGRDASEEDDAPATIHVDEEATPIRTDAHASLPSHDALTPSAVAVTTPRDDAPTPIDGRLTVRDEKPTVAHDDGIADRVRSAAMSASDAHAIRRGARADVDLGSDGRLTISAEKPHAVRIDADVSATARTLERHAPELAADLRERGAGDVRVTIGGPATSSTFAGDSGRSRRDDRERSDADPSEADGTTVAPPTRVRIVL